MEPPKNFEDFILPRSSFFLRIRDSRILPPSSPPSPPLYFRNYTFPPAENNDNTTEIVRPEDHETSCQFALTLSPTTMYPASRTSARSTSRYSFAMDYDINITVTNDDDPFTDDTDLNIPESRETNIPRPLQHNNGNERALYAPLSAMNSDENSRNSPRSLFNQSSTITNPSRSERPQNEQRASERRQNYMQESQISWLGQHPYALTSFQQHYEQDDKPDLSQENSNVMLTESETSQSVHYKEFTPDLFLFSIFDAIMKYLNAEYALRSSLKNSRYVVLLRVPILKRSFGGFKGTYVLAKELVAEMALEELIKQMPHVVYIVLKSKGLDDVLDNIAVKMMLKLRNWMRIVWKHIVLLKTWENVLLKTWENVLLKTWESVLLKTWENVLLKTWENVLLEARKKGAHIQKERARRLSIQKKRTRRLNIQKKRARCLNIHMKNVHSFKQIQKKENHIP
ncbi:13351_t:CDS:2 [Racocetra fulgida]|uniref:13351_t:CDS:1 n=1 Tax=Racocetra fulgida TaxID=60492 RepID=A0A9N8YV26_9GLOM|nr:13351_t:CDS:2 [Racocetra fulgida]